MQSIWSCLVSMSQLTGQRIIFCLLNQEQSTLCQSAGICCHSFFFALLLPFIVTLKHGNCLHCSANMHFFPSALLNYICMLFRNATWRLFKPKRLNSCDKQFSKTSWHLTSIHQIVSYASSMWKEQRMTKKNCLSFCLTNALKELSKGILLLPLMEWMNERL